MKATASLLCFILFNFSLTAIAQEGTVELNPVTVTSALHPTSVSKTGRNIIVIKGEQFNQLPVHSVDELLRYVPGIEIQSRGPMGTQSDIVMRGGTFQQVLVIIDGLRLNDPLSGHFSTYFPIAPAEIDHIEILKGASSAIYGSEAVGGVVHIITKSFAAKQNVQQKAANASLAVGQYSLVNAQGGGFYNNGKTAVGGGLLTNNTNGQPQRGTDGFFNLTTASVSVSRYINSKLHFALRSAYDYRNFSAQNFYTSFVSDTAKERVQSNWNAASISYQKTKDRFSLDAGFKTTDDQYGFNPKSIPNRNKSRLFQTLLRNDHQFSSHLFLNTGLQFINRSIHSNDRGDHNENGAAGFAVLNYHAASGFSVSPSLRLDWNERRSFEWVPQLSLGYALPQWQFRGSLGKTIRDADFTERYNNYKKPLVTSGRIGNPDLHAETSFNYEMGADFFAAKNFKISGTFFQRYHHGLIDYVPTPYDSIPHNSNLIPTGRYAFAKNIAQANITGAELDIQYTQSFANSNNSLWGSIGATWAKAKSTDGASANALYLSSFANLLTNFNLAFSTPRFTLSVNGLYKERKKQMASAIKAELSGDYFVMNTKAQWSIFKKRIALFTQVDNVLNTHYSDLLGAQMPGRWWIGGASFKL